MAAAGESALKQKLKETDTIQWYQGKCTLKEDIKHIDQDNPKSFESIVRACINKKSYVSATDVNKLSGMFTATVERVDIDVFKRSLVLACYLAGDDYAAEKFETDTLNDTYLGDRERLVEKRVDSWIKKGLLKDASTKEEEWALRDDLVATLSGLINWIDPLTQTKRENVFAAKIARERTKVCESRRTACLCRDSLSSSYRTDEFRKDALAFYVGDDEPQCMLTGKTNRVEVAYLLPPEGADWLPNYGLAEAEITNPRNSLLLNRQIHHAFDQGQLTFLWDFMNDRFYCAVLDPKLRSETSGFPKVHGKRLKLKRMKMPFRRLINPRAFVALKKWETDESRMHGLCMNNEGTQIDVDGQFLFRPEHYPGWPWLQEDSTQASSTTEGGTNEGPATIDGVDFNNSWEFHQQQAGAAA